MCAARIWKMETSFLNSSLLGGMTLSDERDYQWIAGVEWLLAQ
jgi:hypothetical protein